MRNRRIFTSFAFAGCIFAHGSAFADEECVDHPQSALMICVDWDKTGEPLLGGDFFVSFSASANPDVELRTGAKWNVRSKDSNGDPGNIGDIKIEATVVTDSFDVTITDNTGGLGVGGPGALNVGSIILADLDGVGPNNDDWTGHSSITTGHITGDLAGDLTVVKDTSDNGGTVTLRVDGDVNGNVDIPSVNSLVIYGDFGNTVHGNLMTIGYVTGGLDFHGDCNGDVQIGEVSGTLNTFENNAGNMTIDLLTGYMQTYGSFLASSVITIKELRYLGVGTLTVAWITTNEEDEFAGTLKLPNGISDSTAVYIKAPMTETAVIDFVGADMITKSDIVGTLGIEGPSNMGDLLNINRVINRLIFCAHFGGIAEIESVPVGGKITAIPLSNIAGQIKILGDMAGVITLDSLEPPDCSIPDPSPTCPNPPVPEILVGGLISGTIDISNTFSGNICAQNVAPGGPLDAGIITVGSMGASAELCGYTVNCLTASDCVDLIGVPPNEVPNTCTDDFCEQNYCWNPGNGSCGSYPPAPARPYLANQKNRYLSFDPGNRDLGSTDSWAFAVEMTVGPGETGPVGWVGEPDANGVSPLVAEVDAYSSSDWPSVIHVAGCEIVPDATYEIKAETDGEPITSALQLTTIPDPAPKFWGDVVGTIENGVYTPPNGSTNFQDVSATIQGFLAAPNAAHSSWLDVDPECPNGVINFNDTLKIILAFTGDLYPYSDPEDCDPCTGPGGGNINFLMVADHELIDPDEQVVIDVHVEPALDVGAYEVSLEVVGGTTGTLDLTSMTVNKARTDYIFGTSSVADAVDDTGGRLAAAMTDGTGVDVTTANDYLGTFTYTASSDASGVFEVKVRSIAHAFLSDLNGDSIGTSSGNSLFIGVDVECVNDGHCDDLSECTDDACVNNVCQNTNNNCDDANDCTSDTCNAGVCEHSNEPPGTSCEDGQFCTTPDTCDNKGTCIGGPNDPCLPTEICIEFLDVCGSGS